MDSRISVHSKRFFRVVLQSIDPNRDNPDSFALKLSIRTRTSLPRARQVVRNLPCTIKQGVSVDRANKLKELLEALGGRVRVESYLETPGVDKPEPSRPAVHLGLDDDEVIVELRDCVACGEALEEGAEVCSSCRARVSPVDEEEDVPEDVPGESHAPTQSHAPAGSKEIVIEEQPPTPLDIAKVLRENKFLVAAGILVILLVIAIIKQ